MGFVSLNSKVSRELRFNAPGRFSILCLEISPESLTALDGEPATIVVVNAMNIITETPIDLIITSPI
jgi:hypothetical protein